MQQQGWGSSPPNHPSPQGRSPQQKPTRAPARSSLVWKLVGALFFSLFVFRATQTSLAAAILIAASALAVLVAVGLGLWVSSAPAVTRAAAEWARRWPNFVAIEFPTALIGAFMGAT